MLIDFSGFIGGSGLVQDESGASVLVAVAVAVVLFGYGYLTMRGLASSAPGDARDKAASL